MTRDQILEQTAEIIRDIFQQDDVEIDGETTALDVDGWDSLSHTMLLLEVETQFKVRLPADRVYELANVGELVDLVAKAKGVA